MAGSFDSLVAAAEAASVEGWDFGWLDGRATEERPSWGYQRLLRKHLAPATAALDIQTGGGEVLAGVGAENFPPTMAATEGWPPNVRERPPFSIRSAQSSSPTRTSRLCLSPTLPSISSPAVTPSPCTGPRLPKVP